MHECFFAKCIVLFKTSKNTLFDEKHVLLQENSDLEQGTTSEQANVLLKIRVFSNYDRFYHEKCFFSKMYGLV